MLIKRRSAVPQWLAVVLVGLTLTACGTGPALTSEGAQVVPNNTLQDLVTYGDLAVRFTVIAKSEIPLTAEEVKRGEGTATRQVTARQDGDPLWTRPTRADAAPLPAREWVISDGGWMVKGGKRIPMPHEGRPPLVVGQQYVAVRTLSSLGEGTAAEWFSLCSMALRDGKVQFDLENRELQPGSYLELDNLSVPAVADRLAATEVDPRAAPYLQLDASQRYRKSLG
jgi:hypothetical protein